jgi:hypothetical protein
LTPKGLVKAGARERQALRQNAAGKALCKTIVEILTSEYENQKIYFRLKFFDLKNENSYITGTLTCVFHIDHSN